MNTRGCAECQGAKCVLAGIAAHPQGDLYLILEVVLADRQPALERPLRASLSASD